MTDPPGSIAAHAVDAADAAASLGSSTPAARLPSPSSPPPASSLPAAPTAAAVATATATATATASATTHSLPTSYPAPPVAVLRPRSPPVVTGLERWTLRASDSQFNALSGAIGGFTAGVVVCPLDVIKTKLQAQGGFAGQAGQPPHHRLYNGLVGTASVIWRDEGLRGMYRGLGPIILGYLPTWAVWFTVYNKCKVRLGERYDNAFVINFWSSIVAGASSTVVTNPIWVIKTRLMSQMPSSHDRPGFSTLPRGASTPTSRPTLHTPWHYRSTLDAARKMYTTEGVLSFYSGLTPALLGLTHVAVQFPVYEYLKTRFTGQGMGGISSTGSHDHDDEEVVGPSHWFGVLSATVLSKIMASSLTYPHEVIRTRLQTQRRPPAAAARFSSSSSSSSSAGAQPSPLPPPRYKGVIKTFRTILREEGWRAFYAGLGTNMMRAVPAATVTMMTYETVMRKLKRTRREAQRKLDSI